MASSPSWKVYTRDGEYVAACKDAEDAAALVGIRGEGATVRYDHRHIVWREGQEEQSAGNSYDFAADVMHSRIHAIINAARVRRVPTPGRAEPAAIMCHGAEWWVGDRCKHPVHV